MEYHGLEVRVVSFLKNQQKQKSSLYWSCCSHDCCSASSGLVHPVLGYCPLLSIKGAKGASVSKQRVEFESKRK